jgi:hypothetical protein
MALAAPAPANITARYDGACQRVRQVEGRVTCYSVYDASDTLIQIDEVGGAKAGYIRASGMPPARIAVSAVTRSAIASEIYPRPEALAFLGPPPPISAAVSPARMRQPARAGYGPRGWRRSASRLTRQRQVQRLWSTGRCRGIAARRISRRRPWSTERNLKRRSSVMDCWRSPQEFS